MVAFRVLFMMGVVSSMTSTTAEVAMTSTTTPIISSVNHHDADVRPSPPLRKATDRRLEDITPTATTTATTTNTTYLDPDFRWIVYADLTDEQQRLVTEELNYTEETWNVLGTNPIELQDFSSLTVAQQAAALLLGFTENTWDCDQNHYGNYGWNGLIQYNLSDYWSALGWTRASWRGETDPNPDLSETVWANLTTTQQEAASTLCYFRVSWDMVDMRQWNCYEENHLVDYNWTELIQFDNHWSTLGWTQASWEEGGDYPATSDLLWSELSPAEQDAAYGLCYDEASWDYVEPYDKATCTPGPHTVTNPAPLPDPVSPDVWLYQLRTTDADTPSESGRGQGVVLMEVRRAWAPLGADRFYALVQDNYYQCAGFYRIVPDFIVQWGMAASPAETAKWRDTPIPDDPVLESNTIGMVSFAMSGLNTRTTQLFVNTVNNPRLDEQGFAPFARIIGGMEVFETMLMLEPDPPQNTYAELGNVWALQEYPTMDIIMGVNDPDNIGIKVVNVITAAPIDAIDRPSDNALPPPPLQSNGTIDNDTSTSSTTTDPPIYDGNGKEEDDTQGDTEEGTTNEETSSTVARYDMNVFITGGMVVLITLTTTMMII